MREKRGKKEKKVKKEKREKREKRENEGKKRKKCFLCKQLMPKNKSRTQNIAAVILDKEHQLPTALSSPLQPHEDFMHCMPLETPTYRKFSVFTAGSIEMGAAVQWQQLMADSLCDLPITVLNPRRGNWDPSDVPKADNAGFKSQVDWELDALEKASVICFFFDVTTSSPVTMLELGLWAASGKIVVCCDPRFWRSGNVQIVCRRYGIPFVKTFAELVMGVRVMLGEKGMKLDANGDLVGTKTRPDEQEPARPVNQRSDMPPAGTVSPEGT
jgi:hypothetical protein